MLGKTSRMSSYQNRRKVHKNICPEMGGFLFGLNNTFNNKFHK
jgi:hypothetical protein